MKYTVISNENEVLNDKPIVADTFKVDSNSNLVFYKTDSRGTNLIFTAITAYSHYAWGSVINAD